VAIACQRQASAQRGCVVKVLAVSSVLEERNLDGTKRLPAGSKVHTSIGWARCAPVLPAPRGSWKIHCNERSDAFPLQHAFVPCEIDDPNAYQPNRAAGRLLTFPSYAKTVNKSSRLQRTVSDVQTQKFGKLKVSKQDADDSTIRPSRKFPESLGAMSGTTQMYIFEIPCTARCHSLLRHFDIWY
jgi:hypothetical protein